MTRAHFVRIAALACALWCSWQPAAPAAVPQPGAPRYPVEAPPAPTTFDDALETPIDPSYRLGPGDELTIGIVARSPANYTVAVSPDGLIMLQHVGDIEVGGKTLAEVKRAIEQGIRRVRKDFTLSVRVTRLHKIKVEVVGEVRTPGTLVLGPLTRVAEAVSRAGGPTRVASWRHVRVRRGGVLLQEVDLEAFWKRGESETNVLLETGDQIYVPRAQTLVKLSGEVNQPGEYEVDPGESVKQVVRRAGGVLATGAETAVHVERLGTEDRRELIPADLTRNPPPVMLQDRDHIVVPLLTSVQGRIRVVGAVRGTGENWIGDTLPKEGWEGVNSGQFLLRRGDRVRDVIENVGGLTAKADRGKAKVERPDSRGGKEGIPVNLQALLVEHDESQNVELRDGDTLIVPTIVDVVYVLGSVPIPGPKQYEEGRTVVDYISHAGGVGSRARKRDTTLVRGDLPNPQRIDVRLDRMLQGKKDPRSVPVKPGDIIIVPEAPIKSWQDIAGLVWTARSLFSGLFLLK